MARRGVYATAVRRLPSLAGLSFWWRALPAALLACHLAALGAAGSVYKVSVCGGFSDGGLPEACCFPEAFGAAIAQLAWERGAFGPPGNGSLLEEPAEGLQAFSLDVAFYDVAGDAGQALICAMQEWRAGTLLLLGAGWSSLSVPVATVGPAVQGVQLDWGATSPVLSDTTRYGYFTRVVAPDDLVAKYLARLLVQTWGYRRLLAIFERSDFGQPSFQKFSEQLPSSVELEAVALPAEPLEGDRPAIRDQLRNAARRQMRVVVFLALQKVSFEVVAEPEFERSLLGPGFFWIGTADLIDVGMILRSPSDALISRFAGSMAIGASAVGEAERVEAFQAFVRTLSVDDFRSPLLRAVLPCDGSLVTNMGEQLPGPGPDCWWGGADLFQSPGVIADTYTMASFDAMLTVLYTVNRLLAAGQDPSALSKAELQAALREARFSGLTGRVRFDDRGDRVPGSFALRSIHGPGDFPTAASYDPLDGRVTWLVEPRFSDGTSERPGDSFAPCPPGRYRDYAQAGGEECTRCAEGRFAPEAGMTACLDCFPGSFSDALGASACTPCPLGEFQAEAAALNCSSCPAGSGQPTPGASGCEVCGPGSFQRELGATACERCPRGRYAGGAGAVTCEGCPAGRTTDGSGYSEVASCLCPEGTFEAEGRGCLPCGPGALCRGLGAPPLAKPGFQLDAVLPEGLSLYSCSGDPLACPGGGVGECAVSRRGLACTLCNAGLLAVDAGRCEPCGLVEVWPLVLILVLAPAALVLMYVNVARQDRSRSTHSVLIALTSIAQTVALVQLLGVMSRLSVVWTEPMTSFLAAMKLLTFDLEQLRLGCFIRQSALSMYVAKLAIVPVGLIFLTAMHLFGMAVSRCFLKRAGPEIHTLLGTGGLLMTAFFISVWVTVLSPFQCLEHPNGRWTVLQYPSQLCWDSDEHSAMIAVGCAAVLVPIGYLCFVGWLVWVLPAQMSAGNVGFLNAYAFLFARVKLECRWFWFLFLCRNLLAALVPIITDTFWQVTCMQILFTVSMCLMCWLQPWRLAINNGLEVVACFGILRVLAVCSFFEQRTAVKPAFVSVLTLAGLLGVLFLLLATAAWGLAQHVIRKISKPFQWFLCHFKAEAGSFARLLKMKLHEASGRDNTFIDSDNLSDLDALFQVVAVQTRQLVVICTPQVLSRPWCLGEVTTAYHSGVGLIPIATEGFTMPSQRFISAVDDFVNFEVLTQNGITVQATQAALAKFADLGALTMPPRLGRASLRPLVQAILGHRSSSEGPDEAQLPLEQVSVALVADSTLEGTASALILLSYLATWEKESGGAQSPALHHEVKRASMETTSTQAGSDLTTAQSITRSTSPALRCRKTARPAGPSTLVLMCTQHCFASPSFLDGLCWASEVQIPHVVPVFVSDSFSFPTDSFYDQLRKDAETFTTMPGAEMVAYVRSIFKKIALPFNTLGNASIIEMQAQLIQQRITQAPQKSRKRIRLADDGPSVEAGSPESPPKTRFASIQEAGELVLPSLRGSGEVEADYASSDVAEDLEPPFIPPCLHGALPASPERSDG